MNNKVLSAEACRAMSPRVLSCHAISDHRRPTLHSRPASRPRSHRLCRRRGAADIEGALDLPSGDHTW